MRAIDSEHHLPWKGSKLVNHNMLSGLVGLLHEVSNKVGCLVSTERVPLTKKISAAFELHIFVYGSHIGELKTAVLKNSKRSR